MAFVRVCKERLAPEAQAETRAVAQEIAVHLRRIFPSSMEAWGLPADAGAENDAARQRNRLLVELYMSDEEYNQLGPGALNDLQE